MNPEQTGAELFFLMTGILERQEDRELHPDCGQDGFAEQLWPYAEVLANIDLGDEGAPDVFSYSISEEIAAGIYINLFDAHELNLKNFKLRVEQAVKEWQGLTEKEYTMEWYKAFYSYGTHKVIATSEKEAFAKLDEVLDDLNSEIIYDPEAVNNTTGILKTEEIPKPRKRKTFEEVLTNCDDQIVVRALLMSRVPEHCKDEIASAFNTVMANRDIIRGRK